MHLCPWFAEFVWLVLADTNMLTRARTRARTRTHTRARAHTHLHTHTRAVSLSLLSLSLSLSLFPFYFPSLFFFCIYYVFRLPIRVCEIDIEYVSSAVTNLVIWRGASAYCVCKEMRDILTQTEERMEIMMGHNQRK